MNRTDQLDELIAGSRFDEIEAFVWCDDNDTIAIDWREDDLALAEYVCAALPIGLLSATWDEAAGDINLALGGHRSLVGLTKSPVDRCVTICAINRQLAGRYEVRAFAASVGTGDTIIVIVQPREWWERMDSAHPKQMARIFVKFVEGCDLFACGSASEAAKATSKPWDQAVADACAAQARQAALRKNLNQRPFKQRIPDRAIMAIIILIAVAGLMGVGFSFKPYPIYIAIAVGLVTVKIIAYINRRGD